MGETLQQTQTNEWTDAQIEQMLGSFEPINAEQRILAEENSGVDIQRVQLWRLGVLALKGEETDMILAAQSRTVML